VKELAEEFNIKDVAKIEKTTLSNLGNLAPDNAMVIESDGPVTAVFPDSISAKMEEAAAEMNEDAENMSGDDEDFEDMEEEGEKKQLV